MPQYQDLDIVWHRLQRSAFRSGFRLNEKDLAYLRNKGTAVVLGHAREFISARLAPALPAKDGKQTPWRGHPVFVAQHATATCCRGCLEKWHGIARGRALDEAEQGYIVRMIALWLERRGGGDGPV